ncbi:MAG: tetratricopeptide repeat protein [Treponema sp.]|jgi:tetratricopeptide (TPR) repeat protein|nr:tetratricopeptide repeat protein [Treponema sp.]
MKKLSAISAFLLFVSTSPAFSDAFTDELQWLAKLTACIGQYNMAQTGDYTVKDPRDYYRPGDIREWLAKQDGSRTVTQTFYGICFDYAQWAYNTISQNQSQYERLGMNKGGYYIVSTGNNPRQIILYDPVSKDKATVRMNGVYVKEHSRQNLRAHNDATNHAWLWVFGAGGTIYWLDPTWTDNSGYVWWGVVQNGEETQIRPSADYCMVTLPGSAAFGNFNKGNANKNLGNWDQAIADYTEVLREDPGNAIAYCSRGSAYINKRDYDRAIADLNQAIRLDPNDAISYNERGFAYDHKGGYDQAIADFNQALRLNPGFAVAYNNRGEAYRKKGNLDRAIADYDQAIRLDPTRVRAYSNRGLAYTLKGNHDRAIADLNQAIRLDPNFAIAYYNRGYAYQNKGDYNRAVEDYTRSLRLEPNFVLAYINRGAAYYYKGDRGRARADWQKALQIDPYNKTARDNLQALR